MLLKKKPGMFFNQGEVMSQGEDLNYTRIFLFILVNRFINNVLRLLTLVEPGKPRY